MGSQGSDLLGRTGACIRSFGFVFSTLFLKVLENPCCFLCFPNWEKEAERGAVMKREELV